MGFSLIYSSMAIIHFLVHFWVCKFATGSRFNTVNGPTDKKIVNINDLSYEFSSTRMNFASPVIASFSFLFLLFLWYKSTSEFAGSFHRNMAQCSCSNQIVNALIDQSELILSFERFSFACPIHSAEADTRIAHDTTTVIRISKYTQHAYDSRIEEINLVPIGARFANQCGMRTIWKKAAGSFCK